MSSVPQSKASVGSAVNDTTREVGGAFGIAVLGSILNSVYRGSIDLSSFALPDSVAAAAGESMGGALFATSGLPAEIADAVRTIAAQTFTDAVGTVFPIAAIIAIVASITVFIAGRKTGVPPELAPVDG